MFETVPGGPARYQRGVVALLFAVSGLLSGTGYAQDAGEEMGPEAALVPVPVEDERGFSRFLDRQYLIDNGHELPGQFGVAAFASQSESDLPISDLKFSFDADVPLESNPVVSMDDLATEITNTGVILDYWILPFVDLYTIVGYSDGDMLSAVNTPVSSQPIPISFTAKSLTLGSSVVLGYKRAFLLLDYNYMKLDTDVYVKKIPVENTTVRAGLKFGGRWLPEIAWVSYINTEFKGTFDLVQSVGEDIDPGTVPPGTTDVLLSFKVAKYDTWAVGAQWELTKKFFVVSELGFDTVESLTVALNYRIE